MYATVSSFVVWCLAICFLLNIRKVRDFLRQWHEDMLAPEVADPDFDLDFRCPSEDTADDAMQLPTADVPGESGETAESTEVDCPWITAFPPPQFYVGPAMFATSGSGNKNWSRLVRRRRRDAYGCNLL